MLRTRHNDYRAYSKPVKASKYVYEPGKPVCQPVHKLIHNR